MKKTSVYSISEGDLELPGEMHSVVEIKMAIRDKYGYPVDKQHIHHNGKKYIMAQIANDTSVICRTENPFLDEFKRYGCPENLVELLFSQGSTKDQIYERLLPGMNDRGTQVAKEKKCLDIAKFEQFINLLKMDTFKEEDFRKLICEDDLCEFIDNENDYCEKTIEKLQIE